MAVMRPGGKPPERASMSMDLHVVKRGGWEVLKGVGGSRRVEARMGGAGAGAVEADVTAVVMLQWWRRTINERSS